jgi:O-antigen ligase
MFKLTAKNLLNRTQLERNADWLAIAVVASLPWSTSATSILVVVWLLALIPTLNAAAVRDTMLSPAGGLPVALFGLGVLGMVWADGTLTERFHGLDSFFKLLMIPLLMVQFQRSNRGRQVLIAFLISCVVLLIASYIVNRWPTMPLKTSRDGGVMVKDYVVQSAEFMICAFVLLSMAFDSIKLRRFKWTILCALLAVGFLADIFFVATSRTTLVALPVLAVLLGGKQYGWKGCFGAIAAAIVIMVTMWASSHYLRDRISYTLRETQSYRTENIKTPISERFEFWKKSIEFITEAPMIGHGTGSIRQMFQRAAVGTSGTSSEVSTNPHNQTFAVAIQLGLVGAALLWAMWIAHVLLFRGSGLVSWIGLVIVVQNIVGSLFNSHLFDFAEGWIYVFGVGVTAGMVGRQWAPQPAGPNAVAAQGQ